MHRMTFFESLRFLWEGIKSWSTRRQVRMCDTTVDACVRALDSYCATLSERDLPNFNYEEIIRRATGTSKKKSR